MPLTELIIDGFKSFAEKTTIHFGDGISGIVGPNGSGKSNITEAIRWAMGESRAKTLRGNNMKDVIFAGSEFRKPLNSASVTLVFDNKNRQLNFDSDQVSVQRRILRSGDSDYLINNQSVRLKDVRELFLDSGISQNSLAIISQGRVDQILNSRPEDRRTIFEEAAGVLHFKEQKEAANHQLEETNNNLIRINDLVKELEQRIEPLHEQSSLAKEYKFQKTGLDKKLKTLLAFEIENLSQTRQQVQAKADQNQALLAKLDKEAKQSQQALADKRNNYQMVQSRRDSVQADLLKLTQEISNLSASLQMAEQTKQFNEATRDEYSKQILDYKKQISSLKSEIDDLNQQQEYLKQDSSQLEKQKSNLTSQLTENPDELNHKIEAKRNEYIQLLQEQTTINNKIVYLKTELNRSQEDKTIENSDLTHQLSLAEKQLVSLKANGQILQNKRQLVENKLTSSQEQLGALNDQLSSLRQLVAEQRNALQKLTARKEALGNIQNRHEGYYFGVRNVLNHLDEFQGVIGVVGELITFPRELSAAMTTALGAGVQNLVTESKISARNAINILKRKHAGRATFLPLDGLRYHQIPASTVKSLQSFPGFKGIASQLVQSNTPIDISSAINYLLGSVIIVDTIDTAMSVSNRIDRYRIVTLDGDIISPGGSMTGGARNKQNNSPLQITSEINQLDSKIKTLSVSLNGDQQKLNEILIKQESEQINLDKFKQEFQDLNQELKEAALSFQSQEKEVNRLRDANSLYLSRKKELELHLNDLTLQLEVAQEKQIELGEQIEQEKNNLANLQNRLDNFSKLNQEVQDELSMLNPKIAVYKNKLENIHSSKKDKQLDLNQVKAQLESLQQKLDDLSENKEASNLNKKEIAEKQAHAAKKQAKLEKELSELSAKLGQFDAQIQQLDQVANRNYDLRKDAAQEQESFSIEITKINSSMNQKLGVLSSDYALTFEAALSQAEGENTPENRQELQRAVRLHKMSLEDIGPVNLDAIEEYENVKQRYDFLNGQQEDLLTARRDLEESMQALDGEVEQRFSKTFEKISENFSKIFPIVFGGGNAKLVLTEPDNMLETGIEIIAQPPGKKLQRLSLLSGGERALTAITLLFAMLEINPVPFCVLDEVEAALDDANVARFARFLQKYDMHTQFIVITHRRGTMLEADQLFGVVMQELGVSKVVSVSLEDIKDEVTN